MRAPDITIELWFEPGSVPDEWMVRTDAPAMHYLRTFSTPQTLDALTATERALLYTMGGVALAAKDPEPEVGDG